MNNRSTSMAIIIFILLQYIEIAALTVSVQSSLKHSSSFLILLSNHDRARAVPGNTGYDCSPMAPTCCTKLRSQGLLRRLNPTWQVLWM